MADPGMAVILVGGKRGLRPGGKSAVFNEGGHCPGCCCEPLVLDSFITNSMNPCWDLTPHQGPGQASPGSFWRLIETGSCYPYDYPWYGAGCVNAKGQLIDLPSQFCSTYAYDGYLELQIGCLNADGSIIRWPGLCRAETARYSC